MQENIKKQSELTLKDNLRQEYINRLVNHYGFSLEQIEEKVSIDDVDKKSKIIAYADILVWSNKEDKNHKKPPLIVVECKAEQVTIREEDYYRGAYFASLAGAKFFVTTNLKETRIFSKIFKVKKRGTDFNLEEIINIPHANNANNEKEIKLLLNQTKEFARDAFSKLLFKCHNIIRNNDKLSPEAAFDEISKVLFIKTLYERKNEKGQIFKLNEYNEDKRVHVKNMNENDLPFYRKLFENVKSELKNDELFEPNETIKIRENSFEAIIKELEIYNLSTTSDDVKGIAFEQFLGRTFRGELGQFFTPRTIVDYMVEILDPEENEKICDPCCGSGGFLIKAFEYVRNKIENDIQKSKEKIKNKYFDEAYLNCSKDEQREIENTVNEQINLLNKELDINNTEGRLRDLSYKCIYGTDANPRMARTAKMNMIMHGDGHGGVHHHDGLIDINGIFKGRFDVILTNPPFGARVEKSLKINYSDIPSDEKIKKYSDIYGEDYLTNVIEPLKKWAEYDNGKNQEKGRSVLSLFETGNFSSLTEVLFIERCLDLLKPGGRMGIVLPEGVLNNFKLNKVREYVEGKAKIINITSIPQDVFIASGATVKPSLLFFKKFTEQESIEYKKTSEKTTIDIKEKYKTELSELKTKIDNKILKKEERDELKNKIKQINIQIEDEIKLEIKSRFDYEIPIVEVDKAGISSTGSQIENELIPISKEFKKYRIKNKIWKSNYSPYQYDIIDNKFKRFTSQTNPETFYI